MKTQSRSPFRPLTPILLFIRLFQLLQAIHQSRQHLPTSLPIRWVFIMFMLSSGRLILLSVSKLGLKAKSIL